MGDAALLADLTEAAFMDIINELCEEGRLFSYKNWNGMLLVTATRP
jgi:hypothetical protein